MEADGAYIVEGLFARPLVQRFNVAKRVRKSVAGYPNLVGCQTIKHESVI